MLVPGHHPRDSDSENPSTSQDSIFFFSVSINDSNKEVNLGNTVKLSFSSNRTYFLDYYIFLCHISQYSSLNLCSKL